VSAAIRIAIGTASVTAADAEKGDWSLSAHARLDYPQRVAGGKGACTGLYPFSADEISGAARASRGGRA